jgi:general secretion pathway protein G
MTKQSGFSLLELLIYMAIVGILIVTIGPRMISYLSEAKDTRAKSEIATFKMTIDQYYAKMGHYPHALEDLIRKPANEPNWLRSLLDPETVTEKDGKIVDPWDNPYVYSPAKSGTNPFTLFSNGDPTAEPPYKIDAWKPKKQ